MPARYILCPVVETIIDGSKNRCPKVMLMHDPGRPLITEPDSGRISSGYVFSAVISDGNGVPGKDDSQCLCLVGGHDMSALDADPEIITLFEVPDVRLDAVRDVLDKTPNEVLTKSERDRLDDLLTDKGLDTRDLNKHSQCWEWASRYCERIVGGPIDIRGLKITLVNEA